MKLLITENQFKNLRKFLTEISIQNAYEKHYKKDIPREIFDEIVAADPFSKPDFLNHYAKWLLSIYKNKKLRLEDLEAATEYFQTHNRYKDKYKNVDWNKLKTLADLYNVIKDDIAYSQAKTGTVNLCQPIKDSKKIYEDGNWCVIVPETEYAACYYGRNTEWCTAWGEKSFDDRHKGKTNRFDEHDEGPLYININKNNQNEKYQFHFETGQFMNIHDKQIDLLGFLNKNPELKNFYNNLFKDKVKDLNNVFSDLIYSDSGCYITVDNWLAFRPAFEKFSYQLNPADILNSLNDFAFHYNYDKDNLRYYFYYINKSNLNFMIDYLIKDGRISEDMDNEDIEEAILDEYEFEEAIERALTWAKADADRNAMYEDITGELRKHFNITNIEYKNNGIMLKMATCPEPVLLWALNDKDYIEGYVEVFGQINFRIDNYGDYYDKEPDRKLFNEYLSDSLNDL